MRRADERQFEDGFVSIYELSLNVICKAVSCANGEPPIVCLLLRDIEAVEDEVIVLDL